jgi:hypothetical protein
LGWSWQAARHKNIVIKNGADLNVMKSGLSNSSLRTFHFGFLLERPDAEFQEHKREIKGLPVSAGNYFPKIGLSGIQ